MVQLVVNEKSKEAKAFLEFVKSLPFLKVIEEKQPNKETLKAMKEVKEGKVIRAKNVKELIKKLNS